MKLLRVVKYPSLVNNEQQEEQHKYKVYVVVYEIIKSHVSQPFLAGGACSLTASVYSEEAYKHCRYIKSFVLENKDYFQNKC